jgi:Leucine rich repeat N-terminal domain
VLYLVALHRTPTRSKVMHLYRSDSEVRKANNSDRSRVERRVSENGLLFKRFRSFIMHCLDVTMTIRLVVLGIMYTVQFTKNIADAQDDTFNEVQSVVASQYDALRQFYLSTRMYSESSMLLHNWNFERSTSDGEYCNFTGVTCDRDFMVTMIELNNTELTGRLPDTLSSFSSLRRLRLYNNSIEGTIPVNLLRIPTLQLLNLGQNLISGTLPEFDSSNLFTRLTLRRNAISGTIPDSLCNLTNLVVIELSQLTRMRGSIPNCFGTLTALTALRLSDVGLTGTVPVDLCSVRLMNGLMPNTFGCDAIACPTGTFQRSVGRQTNENTPCIECNVPSNVIGTTTCQWQDINEPSPSPSTSPTLRPTVPSISTEPLSPIHHSENTTEPTATGNSLMTVQPSSFSLESGAPVTRMPNPTSTSFPTAMYNQSSENGILAHPGYITGIVLLCILLPTFVVVLFVWHRRPLFPTHKRLADETSSYPGSSLQEVTADADFPFAYPSVVQITVNMPESKEFDVGDDLSLNFNDVHFTRYDLALGDCVGPKTQDASTPTVNKNLENMASPNAEVLCATRKVRFNVPESKPVPAIPNKVDGTASNHTTTMGREDWISWILNPLFDPIAACGTPCRYISKSDVEIVSAISLDSTYSNLSALFVAHGAVNPVHPHRNDRKSTSAAPSLVEGSSVLGIRDLNSMNDDSSINSQDGSVVANVGAIFRQNQESRRRVRATWNSLQENASAQDFVAGEGTVEV